jgi:type IV pilus assembly protein PilC
MSSRPSTSTWCALEKRAVSSMTSSRNLQSNKKKTARIRGKFKSAMTYPIILLTITLSVFMLLMVFVMPRIGKIIQDLAGEDAELPTMTKIMLGISDFMVTKWYIIIAVGFIQVFFA